MRAGGHLGLLETSLNVGRCLLGGDHPSPFPRQVHWAGYLPRPGCPWAQSGSEEILHDLVFSPDGRTQVGYDGGSCVLFDVAAPEENCTLTYSLPGGDLTTQLLNSPPPAKIFAVTGGTGTYRNVRGQGKLVESGHETATLTFDLIG